MQPALIQKYAQLKAVAAESANMAVVENLMIDILDLLHQEFRAGTGRRKEAYEQAYHQLDCTVSAHRSTNQDTNNQFYLNEIGRQVGHDIETALTQQRQ